QRGVWYHVAATYDGNQSILYVNGVAEASATPGFPLDYDTTPLFIGTTGTWSPYLNMFGGLIDEASIYNRALSAGEIAAIYNVGSAGKCIPGIQGPWQNQLFNPQLVGGNFLFEFAGVPGLAYTIESAPSPNGPWTKVANRTSPLADQGLGDGVFQFQVPARAPAQFYRTVYPAY
ncbi:MAG TPA: LamG domain-containing protein, partial [Verrucomicrobiae bacterium]|nr:LamG domain-containing protein [Verrucomicrobiae bacterium]